MAIPSPSGICNYSLLSDGRSLIHRSPSRQFWSSPANLTHTVNGMRIMIGILDNTIPTAAPQDTNKPAQFFEAGDSKVLNPNHTATSISTAPGKWGLAS